MRANSIPSTLVADNVRTGKQMASQAAERVSALSLAMLSVVADLGDGRATTVIVIDSDTQQDSDAEVRLLKCAAVRIASLLILHVGADEAVKVLRSSMRQGSELADIAVEETRLHKMIQSEAKEDDRG